MSNDTIPLDEAVERDDVTVAFTPAQLLLLAVAAWLLMRWLRGRFAARGR